MTFDLPFTIYTLLSDRYRRLSCPATAQLLQEIAEMHSTDVGVGYHRLIQDNKIWVLTRVSYRYVGRYPQLDENVKLRTWSKGSNGLVATREFEILSSMNELLVAATSQWVLIDMTSRKALRISDEYVSQYKINDRSALNFAAPRIMIPKEGMQLVKEMKVEFSSVDKAQHVNNAEYIRWIINTLTAEEQERGVAGIDINYQMETRPDEEVKIYSMPCDNGYLFQITNPRGVSINAKVELR